MNVPVNDSQLLKRLFRECGRTRPAELSTALLALPAAALAGGLIALFVSGELRFFPKKRRRLTAICSKFYRYHKENPLVAEWFLKAARSLKAEQQRSRYAIKALAERIRWNVQMGIIKTEGFRISNDVVACYGRLVLMQDPSLCGLFTLRPSRADALVIDGQSWADFAVVHHAELWPAREIKKPVASVRAIVKVMQRKGAGIPLERAARKKP
jgi:hypothetical protein